MKSKIRYFISLIDKAEAPFLLLWIVLTYTIVIFFMPPVGDDLGFIYSFEEQNDCWYALLRYCYRHWIWNNGRTADMLSPLPLCLMPVWLRAILNGIMTSLLPVSILWLGGIRSLTSAKGSPISVFVIFLCIFTFRWDAIWMEFLPMINYVWGASAGISTICLLLQQKYKFPKYSIIITAPLCFIAMGCHEAFGAAASCGLILFLIFSAWWKENDICKKIVMISAIAGGFFPLSSTAAYGRIGMMLQPEPWWEIIFTSGIYPLVMIILTVGLLICKRTRFKELLQSPWIIFSTAAVISSVMMLMSQFGGRTGWFANIFGLIAIIQLFNWKKIEMPSKTFSAILKSLMSVAIVLHLCLVCYWQIILSTETREVINQYKESTDGNVFYDYTADNDLPWIIMRKVHGVPDADDTYYRYRIEKHYGNGKPLVILSTKAKFLNSQKFSGDTIFNGVIITDKAYPGDYTDRLVERFPRIFNKSIPYLENGKEFIRTEFKINDKTYYKYSPVDRDAGEK